MKAIVLTGFGQGDNFDLQEVKDPIIKENEVLVRIMAVSINPVDYQIRLGLAESKLLSSSILGREMAGVVLEIGSNVKHFSVGDEVMGYVGSLGSNGTLAEFISVPYQLLALKPPSVNFEEAAAIPMVGLTALQCFRKLKVHQKDSIFVTGGAGGVGTYLIQLLYSKGVERLITTAGNEGSKNHLKQLGVPENNILDYRLERLQDLLLENNGNSRFNSCIDLVGGDFSFICSSILKIHGAYGNITNNISNRAREQFFDKGISILNISNYANALESRASEFEYYGEELKTLLIYINKGLIKLPNYKAFQGLTVTNVLKAFDILENNKTRGRKIVLTIGSSK